MTNSYAIFYTPIVQLEIAVKMQWGRLVNSNFQNQLFSAGNQFPVNFRPEERLSGILQPLNFEAGELSRKKYCRKIRKIIKGWRAPKAPSWGTLHKWGVGGFWAPKAPTQTQSYTRGIIINNIAWLYQTQVYLVIICRSIQSVQCSSINSLTPWSVAIA